MLLNKRMPALFILKKIRFEIIWVLVIASVVYYLTEKFEMKIPEMPLAIPAFLGTAISVILSFKLSQSYDRWWEARKIWGSIVNDSRALVLQLQSFVTPEDDAAVKRIVLRHIGWVYSLGQHLRGCDPLENTEAFLSENDAEKIKDHKNVPLAILQLNSDEIKDLRNSGRLDSYTHVQLNSTMMSFTDAAGMSERIKNTVFPSTYRLFLHLFIYIFLITLCIALRDIESRFEIPLLLVISSVFFLLEKSATSLEDPFSNEPTDTPVTSIANTIEINLKQLIGNTELPVKKTPESYFIL